ncbi:MAG: transcription termination factor Rho, partial [Abditibacteriota bacterium]|nr:transcription termination factor Rho [Abditibacteriota bacterium]
NVTRASMAAASGADDAGEPASDEGAQANPNRGLAHNSSRGEDASDNDQAGVSGSVEDGAELSRQSTLGADGAKANGRNGHSEDGRGNGAGGRGAMAASDSGAFNAAAGAGDGLRAGNGRGFGGRANEARQNEARQNDGRQNEARQNDGRQNVGRNNPGRNNELRADNRNAEVREERGVDGRIVEGRGLRFRGREGRAEVRGRNDNRAFRLRGEQNPAGGQGGRGDNRPFDNRGDARSEAWRGDGENGSSNGRLAPLRDNNREPRERDHRERHDGRERDLPRGRNELDLTTLEEKTVVELRDIAGELGIEVTPAMKKNDLVIRVLEAQAEASGNLFKRGILEILPDGKGFMRTSGYLPGDEDVYVSQSQIKRFNLKTGDTVSGQVRPPKEMERHYGLLRVEAIDGEPPENFRQRKEFEKMTPIFPDEKFKLEMSQDNITARIIDLVSPIGKGQRGLIVAPPKAGKTTLIKNIANSIATNHPEVVLIVLLIDERPEEVTDISRSVKGEVVASTFDEMPLNHMRVAEMVFEKAKRLVEQGKDVVVLLDSITRLSRASNLVVEPSGRTLSGGLDPAAMYRPKRMFGAARNIEEGGSLTILATTLVDTGSRMDDMIFEEFKGTGNLDLVLDRNLFDQRIFPAIDINKSGTRRDDLLLSKEDLAATFHLRRTLAALDNDKAITLLIDRLKNTKTNEDFMQIVQKSARSGGTQGS